MINFPNGVQLIQSTSELPSWAGATVAYLDFETTSRNRQIDSLNPWHSCWTAGICLTVDAAREAVYVPVGHARPTPGEPNLDKSAVRRWLFDILSECDLIVAQNAKYELHILKNDWDFDFREYGLNVYCTLTQAKLIDSDRMSYRIEDLSKDWLNEDILQYKSALRPYLYTANGNQFNRDYGEIPAVVMAPYGGQDVLTMRKIKHYIDEKMPASCSLVSANEKEMTKILYGIEYDGMYVNPMEVGIKKLETLVRLDRIIHEIIDISGIAMRPNSSEDCYNFLCAQNGLPILEWTNPDDDTKLSNPSFSKNAMQGYKHHPKVREDENLLRCVELIQEFRTLHTFNSLFLNTYSERNIGGVLHSSYNQCVRTARLSCSDPNAQQLSKLAKSLIRTPPEDDPSDPWCILDVDLSQIEFRLIASTINNPSVLEQYALNPLTDYHQLIADLADLDRSPAKNLNFAVGFGAGKKKSISMVKGSLDISSKGYQDSGMLFDDYCQMRATEMYNSYHSMLPELKPTMRKSTNIAAKYGYISNLYGRQRHLPSKAVYKAFNAYIQSSAADLAKDLTIQIANYISSLPLRSRGTLRLIGLVHDSWIFYCRKSQIENHAISLANLIENVAPPNPLRVPIRCSVDFSESTWDKCEPLGQVA